jgi:hypothetical protein
MGNESPVISTELFAAVKERNIKETLAFAALRKIGIVDESGNLIENPSYIKAEQFNHKGEVSWRADYRITAISAYLVEMTYVSDGSLAVSDNVATNNQFWNNHAFSRSTQADWELGKL